MSSLSTKTKYMYYVEYFCPNQYKEDFERAKKREMEKFNEVLTEQIFGETAGYYDSFLISEDFHTEKDACKFAKAKSKETGDLAHVRAGWYEYEFGKWELEEPDENYIKQFNVGREINE